MEFYKPSLLKKTFNILLLSSMLIAAMGVMVSNAKAASKTACSIGVACATGAGGVTVGGGALSATASDTIINNGTALATTGQDQIVPFKFLTTVNDARGSGIGWNITASATAMAFGTSATSDLFLDATTPVTATCAGNSTCSSPAGLTLATGAADIVTTPTQIVDAPVANGLGSYNIMTLGNFSLPANASAGTATGGIVSITIAAAP